ncbi:hypothetical protein CHCC20441_4317 [Bacillus licheniformis]|uniref:Uncharacterized protein n=1 Tax=Bacillus licheniformis TaxID=1402 RepID=A0A8B5YFG6_BACLI|nr:hypothetical protein B4092_0318 [Bacillus licheniformis]TWN08128.1 hypothetical protein CHCC14564_2640 [Bacillus licheniformis LMG 17339]KYC78833.1 hypothetical protein B4090_0382 [Bacillus licheniformis]KYC85837.1 hypothetical protein B4091_0319 [Bacillus licheniformis]KYD00793.1 hypothetical protein B4164_0281 [Bacillus licheniformis]
MKEKTKNFLLLLINTIFISFTSNFLASYETRTLFFLTAFFAGFIFFLVI